MKLGQLIEYNMTNIFLEKSYTKCCGETILRPVSKKSKLQFVFIVCQVAGYQYILKLICRPFAFISYKDFLRKKEIWN